MLVTSSNFCFISIHSAQPADINRSAARSLRALSGFAIVCAALLAGCATQPAATQSASSPPATITTTPGTQPLPETKLPAAVATPSVLIAGRQPRDVIDDIVKYRTGRGMKVRTRSNTKVEFAETVTKAKEPTEARMVYQLAPVKGGLQLSARVFQVSYPGTASEKVAEITSVVAEKLNQELPGYAQSSNWH